MSTDITYFDAISDLDFIIIFFFRERGRLFAGEEYIENGFYRAEGIFCGKSLNLTQDRPFPTILRFSLPLIVGSVIQILFNAVDIMVLGNMADSLKSLEIFVVKCVTLQARTL